MDITPLNVQYEDVHDNNMPPPSPAPEVKVTESSPMISEARALGRDSPEDIPPVVESQEPVQAFGYLHKQGRRFKRWNQRWFEIRGQHMYYYKTTAKKHLLGEILLNLGTQVHPTTAATFGHAFEILTKERSHLLAAKTVEDMEKWIDTIKKNIGSKSGSKTKKVTKVKKWDSFKNAFVINRHRSASPQSSNPLPDSTASLPSDTRQKVEVTRNKSFLDKFKRIKRDRSPSPRTTRREVALKDDTRPRSEDYSKKHELEVALVDPPTAISVPNSPLTRKRKNSKTREERTSLSPSPYQTPTPASSGVPSPTGTPERKAKPPSATPSPPQHSSTPLQTAESSSPPRRQQAKKQLSPSPLIQHPATEEKAAIPEILTQHIFWDDLKTLLDSVDDSQPLFPDTLLPQDEPWMEKDTPVEQLREFLAVCS